MAYQFTKSKSRELQEWIIGQIREVLPDESISIFSRLKGDIESDVEEALALAPRGRRQPVPRSGIFKPSVEHSGRKRPELDWRSIPVSIVGCALAVAGFGVQPLFVHSGGKVSESLDEFVMRGVRHIDYAYAGIRPVVAARR